jgi:acyl carrier protein
MDIEAIVMETALELSVLDKAVGSHLKEDLGLDSLAVTQLIVALEGKLGLEIDMSLLMDVNLQTINDLCGIVRKSMEG